MQAGAGQFGVPEVQQFVVARGPPFQGHMFTLAHDVSVSTSSAAHGHAQHTQHPQNQQLLLNNASSQRQHQPVQLQHSHHSNPQPNNHQHLQLPRHLQVSQQQQEQQGHQQFQHQQFQQQQLVQKLGFSSDSPERISANASKPFPSSFKQMLAARDSSFGEEEGLDDDERSGGGPGSRWPRQETLALIRVRSDMDSAFRDAALKGPLWEEVSRKLVELGYPRSARKCKEKFENIYKYYKKTKDGKSGRQDGKNYRFFSEFEALYGGGVSTLNGGGGKSEATQGDAGGETLKLKSTGYVSAAVEKVSMPQRLVENYGDANMSYATSEDDYDDSADMDEKHSRKRKRKSWNSRMGFFENLMKNYIDKQESILRKFLDVIERHEQNRIAREDAYRMQEIARASREEALRTQEHALATSRDEAIIAFLQKTTGQFMNLPQIKPNVSAYCVPEEQQDKEPFDSNCKRWPKPEVLALIQLRSDMEPKFHEAGLKGPLWEEIASRMASFGYNRNSKRCKEKWENINKYFRKTKNISKKRSENAKTCPYFHRLDALYRNGVLGTPINNKALKLEDNIPGEPSESNKDDSCQLEVEVDTIPDREADATGATPTSNCNSIHCVSDEIRCRSETGLKKDRQTGFAESGRCNVGSCNMMQLDGLPASEIFSENIKKSAKLDNLVKEMFGIQQRHQRIFNGYDEKDADIDSGNEHRRQGSSSTNNFAQQNSH
ncbi:hypothetical protein O6H91_17G044300 [Diphasiastrum complanatum]|uniref:Uncharacterized protein n=4 Tax=Diphasiastrum complanatum TaxID=34168 RepID=A0ACC2B7D8_DIPCM|nr:hypothetical protein O6H91_17G044300 [Diphasiastrum complanatum]KAJ7525292.1 hypothetical protein O6H91_17G044300 [Diphasiastrum complanatum]KAJ7525293.1 hypothetical protein O6H91_17G044300 [Diphasiastrum complanatum]KAJ7525294.1 hypothetical protein O6H91_17G044300 [Diphasiastrum complanatum]